MYIDFILCYIDYTAVITEAIKIRVVGTISPGSNLLTVVVWVDQWDEK